MFIYDLPYYLGFRERAFWGTAPTIYRDYVDNVFIVYFWLLYALSIDYLGFFPTERVPLVYDCLTFDWKAIDYFVLLRLVSWIALEKAWSSTTVLLVIAPLSIFVSYTELRLLMFLLLLLELALIY